jgi:uncharacterized protein (DUF1810 family)
MGAGRNPLDHRRKAMTERDAATPAADPYDLARFVAAQQATFPQALAELRAGRKRSHWIWFVLPQLDGLGSSPMAKRYAIRSLAEARAYLQHPVLGPRLLACFEALLALAGRSAHAIMGSPDDMKLKSCATLFEQADPTRPEFGRLLDKYYGGERDPATLRLLAAAGT